MFNQGVILSYLSAFLRSPDATAEIFGNNNFPEIEGTMCFYQTDKGVLAGVEISGLPSSDDVCKSPVFALHIHEGSSCTGNANDSFANVMSHYNPRNCPHPYHAGDLPPLFGANGYAFSVFLTDRFTVNEIMGKTVIIHSDPDDFTTQPSGNAGTKIACGVIK